MKRYLLIFVFIGINTFVYSQTNPNFHSKKNNNRYKSYVDTSTIVIFNERIYSINDSSIQLFLKKEMDSQKTTIQVINDEKSKTSIKHILIIHTIN